MAPTFLTLPRELRDQIVANVVTSCRPYPIDHHDRTNSRRPGKGIANGFAFGSGLEDIMFETQIVTPATRPLLLTNWQLHDEVAEYIQRLTREDKVYHLDLMFAEEKELRPTWTYIPTFTRELDRLEVDIRISGADMHAQGEGWRGERGRRGHTTIWTQGCGGPPSVVWPFYSMLRHVLQHGADTPKPKSHDAPQQDRRHLGSGGLLIRKLVLNFTTTAEAEDLADANDERPWFECRNSHWRDVPDQVALLSKVMRPEWLANYLRGLLCALLSLSYQMAAYGAVLYRIGAIEIQCDGRLGWEADLGPLLAGLQFNDNFGNMRRDMREGYFENWKRDMMKWRQNHGLSVGPDASQHATSA